MGERTGPKYYTAYQLLMTKPADQTWTFIRYSLKMTKLTEWLIFAGLAFSVWITLLADILPVKLPFRAKEVIWPMPVYALIVFGCYSLATIGYRVATFNDCVEASESLQQEIKDAREDLTRKGFKFD